MQSKADTRYRVTLTLNGRERSGYAEPRMQLCDFLRHDLGATGTHVGCEHGVCGACTVLVNGRASRSCLMLAVQADGKQLETVESLAAGDELNDLQKAFRKHHALQCGFCTSGILMSSMEFLAKSTSPTEPEVREMLSGHLCRCTGYTGIVNAILEVAEERNSGISRQTDINKENNNV
ncbi:MULTISPECIES: (2Fe-2S)-binding protein [unclassified Marinobacter]|jgi:2-furoyl-CoA dehydrogenase 2Fe-2S iron sulfur subunit|uniref:(2Fe-2S)-binding protein n=1 Tax=unclassified Marinobacter TaxID=83889 RepID=UPI00200C65A7|nr:MULTISPECIES: (2Fe-2S)-binding protein [unclassified Marinobacter]MCL1481452.1 (2Fe-2S)-binding protein [Marinobacter sp.]UQG54502.1 (2Fe-2S)-binding protein [Marinobacter sp. M4C]UQG63307.1 (2Fe-2S)-binding protein [Marinobacter sp. M2C]UQG67587.1 (2Fe-2S)-binding protein [Marinobacter sp. M1C]